MSIMKGVVLSLLIVLYTFQIDQTISQTLNEREILKMQVEHAKSNVKAIINKLELLYNYTVEDTNRKVVKKSDEEVGSFRSYKRLLLNQIRKEVNVAKESGKKADGCYDEAVVKITQIEKTARTKSKKCEKNGEKSITNNLGFIDNLISIGYGLISQLDSIFLICYDSDISRMQSCVFAELARINSPIRSLESDSNAAKITVVPLSNNIITQSSNCIKTAYSVARTNSIMIKMGVGQCIEEANKPDPSTPEPMTVTPKSTTVTPKSMTVTPKPTTVTPKPTTVTPEPTTVTLELTDDSGIRTNRRQ